MLDKSKSKFDESRKREEFQGIAFEYIDSLYSTALRMTRNDLDAEDLVQDVYLRAFRFFHKFEKGTNFKAWIFKILTNTYINQYRKRISKPYHVDLDKVKHTFSEKDHDSRIINANEQKHGDYDALFDDEIKQALERLPDDFRVIVLLADVDSFSYKEIAQIVGCPLGTVMSRLSRGRKQLQNNLKEYAVKGGFVSK